MEFYMIENTTIWSPSEAENHPSLIQLSSNEHSRIAEKLKFLDEYWQIELNKSVYENSYDNDDYLFVSDILQDIRELHKKIYYNPYEEKWVKENREIPYIHLEFINQPALKRDEWGGFIPDDKKLNMGVRPPLPNGAHILRFNYYWLKRYLTFLQTVFDSNEEEVFSLPPNAEGKYVAEYKSREEIARIAKDLAGSGCKDQAKSLLEYANSFIDCDKIEMPCLTFLRIKGEKQVVTWCFYDEASNSIKIPMKKSIYNTSGFVRLFEERNALVYELFTNSLKMILAHETAHVARGHWLLRVKEPSYSMQRNVMMNCEINADWTATHWILNELLYDTLDGDPYSNTLAYTEEAFIHLMSVRVLAIYLSLSWMHQEENDRVWTESTITNFVEDKEATHPLYQFRLFCALIHIKEHLEHMASQNEKEGNPLVTADNKPLSRALFDEVWSRSCDMIFSFEYSFRACWDTDERGSLDKIRDGLFIMDNVMPDKKENVPFFLCYMKKAYNELSEYEKQWPEILGKLREYGMFFRM